MNKLPKNMKDELYQAAVLVEKKRFTVAEAARKTNTSPGAVRSACNIFGIKYPDGRCLRRGPRGPRANSPVEQALELILGDNEATVQQASQATGVSREGIYKAGGLKLKAILAVRRAERRSRIVEAKEAKRIAAAVAVKARVAKHQSNSFITPHQIDLLQRLMKLTGKRKGDVVGEAIENLAAKCAAENKPVGWFTFDGKVPHQLLAS